MENKTGKWIIEVKVNDKWEAVRPTGGKRYEYSIVQEAYAMLTICYPDCIIGEQVRVRQLDKGE